MGFRSSAKVYVCVNTKGDARQGGARLFGTPVHPLGLARQHVAS